MILNPTEVGYPLHDLGVLCDYQQFIPGVQPIAKGL